MTTPITVVWAGGEHEFLLSIGQLRALEERTKAGAFVVLTRLLASQWYVDDVIQPLRLGLIGAGMPANEAAELISKALDVCSPHKLAIPAADILSRFIMWDDEVDQPGEDQGETEVQANSPTE